MSSVEPLRADVYCHLHVVDLSILGLVLGLEDFTPLGWVKTFSIQFEFLIGGL